VEVEENCIHYFGSNDTNEDEEKDEGASEEVAQIQIPTKFYTLEIAQKISLKFAHWVLLSTMTMNQPLRTSLHHKKTTTMQLRMMGDHGDGLGLITGSREMVSVRRLASIFFLELRWKGLQC
jgi:hypothetical protein